MIEIPDSIQDFLLKTENSKNDIPTRKLLYDLILNVDFANMWRAQERANNTEETEIKNDGDEQPLVRINIDESALDLFIEKIMNIEYFNKHKYGISGIKSFIKNLLAQEFLASELGELVKVLNLNNLEVRLLEGPSTIELEKDSSCITFPKNITKDKLTLFIKDNWLQIKVNQDIEFLKSRLKDEENFLRDVKIYNEYRNVDNTRREFHEDVEVWESRKFRKHFYVELNMPELEEQFTDPQDSIKKIHDRIHRHVLKVNIES